MTRIKDKSREERDFSCLNIFYELIITICEGGRVKSNAVVFYLPVTLVVY